MFDITRVSKSGYYRWLKTSEEQDKDHSDYLIIKDVFEDGKKKLGFRTVKMELKEEKNIIMNHKKIIRIMKKYNLVCKIRRRNPYKAIMKKTQEHRTFENKLNREFNQESPYKFFSTDITYLFYKGGLAYLSVVKDIVSKEVIAWETSRHIDMHLVLNTVEYLKNNKNICSFKNVMIHSDQGFHYTNPTYIKMIKDLGMTQSMSRKGNCIDNAPIESFFGHMKDDIDYKDCRSSEELKVLVDKYMYNYNNTRYQWKLKKMTPVQYRNHLLAQK